METYSAHYSTPAMAYTASPMVGSPYDRLKAAIAEAHPATAEHSVRVRILATSVGLACKLSGSDLTSLAIAAEVHDIGKLRVPHAILDKPDKLTESEWLIIRQHPMWGARMVTTAFPDRPEIAQCVLTHHERLDGSGYPSGLTANQIPMLSRIVSAADAFIALTENRKFRPAYDPMSALKIMTEEDKGRYDESILTILSRLI